MKYLFALLGLLPLQAICQEYNFGLHFNPALSIPILDSKSIFDDEIRYSPLRLNYNIGVNANLKYKGFSLETGANIVQKSIHFKQHLIGMPTGTNAYYYMRYNGTSFEFPLLAGAKVLHNEGATIYDLYLQGGASYELYKNDAVISGSGVNGPATLDIRDEFITTSKTLEQKQWFNAIVGFKINTIIKGVGLVDYGMTYHLPFGYTGPYRVESTVSGPNGQHVYKGEFHPVLSYLDLKICYYLFNLDNDLRRVRYRTIR